MYKLKGTKPLYQNASHCMICTVPRFLGRLAGRLVMGGCHQRIANLPVSTRDRDGAPRARGVLCFLLILVPSRRAAEEKNRATTARKMVTA
jgi:hypothetical protein